jgi:CxxC motif-containing protein
LSQEVTCIICPKSCKINVTQSEGVIEAEGYECKRGEKYGINEIFNPRRIFTSTVILKNGPIRMLPVRTDLPIRKKDWSKAREIVKDIIVDSPAKFGQIIVNGFIEKNIKLISTREI